MASIETYHRINLRDCWEVTVSYSNSSLQVQLVYLENPELKIENLKKRQVAPKMT